MESKAITSVTLPSKLGFTAIAKINMPTMAGCGKTGDLSCGITVRAG